MNTSEAAAVDESFGAEVGRLLDELDTKSRVVEDRKRRVKADQEEFDQAFAHAMEAVVKPAFLKVGGLLTGRGHLVTIAEEQSITEPGVAPAESGMSIRIAPSGGETPLKPDQVPWLSIATRHYNKTVSVRSGNVGSAASGVTGPHGDYPMAQLDRPLVEEQLLKFVRALVAHA